MIGIILAAGNGSRIAAMHSCSSKCMIPVDGKPLLERKLFFLSKCAGINKIVIVIRKGEDEINRYFGEVYKDIPIEYCIQDEKAPGIINAFYSVPDLEKYINEEIILNLGDEYYKEIELNELVKEHRDRNSSVTPIVIYSEDIERVKRNYTIEMNGEDEILDVIEKPMVPFNNYVGCGTMVISGKLIMDFYEKYKYELENKQLADWFKFAINNHAHCYVYKAKTFYCNINSPEDLKCIYSLEYKKTKDSITGMFRNTVKQFPNRTAVVCDEEKITYRELDELSNNISFNLITNNFQRGDCVAIICGRSIEHIITFIGILKAGGYYLPIDENLPLKRIEYMLEKAEVKMIIGKGCFTQGINLGSRLIEYSELVKKPEINMKLDKQLEDGMESSRNLNGIKKLGKQLEGNIELNKSKEMNLELVKHLKGEMESSMNLENLKELGKQLEDNIELYKNMEMNLELVKKLKDEIESIKSLEEDVCQLDYDDEMAYILFTSGSTGLPKGVVIKRSSVVNIVIAMKELVFDKCQEDVDHLRVGVCASFSFDISVQQMYTSLLYGHTLFLVPASAKTRPEQLIKYLNQVDVCDVTPLIMSLVSKYIESNPSTKLRIKHLISCGEELKKSTIHNFFQHCPNVKVTNAYGPTECTVESIMFYMDSNIEDKLDRIPIGRPIRNTRVYILDKEKKLLPVGRIGDIWLAGDGVSPGYYRDMEKTMSVFCPDIVVGNEKMYRTGDLGYLDSDGFIYYVGREDSQIKFKGYRIELGEVEKTIEQYEPVDMCRVIIDTDDTMTMTMIAYIRTNRTDIILEELVGFIHDRLPEFMIPQYYVQVEDFIINNNGKLDKQALPDYHLYALSVAEKQREDEIEEYLQLKTIAEKVNKNPVTVSQSLISAGFDSLKLVYFVTLIEEKYNIRVNLQNINLLHSIKDIWKFIETSKNKKIEEYVKRNRIKALPMQSYLLNLEELLKNTNSIHFFNRLLYFIPVKGILDCERLKKAFEQVVSNADAFKMQFCFNGNCIRVKETDTLSYNMKVFKNCKEVSGFINAKCLGEVDYGAFFKTAEAFTEGYNAPFIEMNYFCDVENSLIAISAHHAVFDYLSFIYFMRNLETYYGGSANVVTKGAFYQYISDENRYLAGNEVANMTEFWDKAFQGKLFNYTFLIKSFGEGYKDFELEGKLEYYNRHVPFNSDENYRDLLFNLACDIRELKSYCQRNEVSEFAVLLGIFSGLFNQEKPMPVLVFTEGRNRIYPYDTIGYFSSLIPYFNDDLKEQCVKKHFQQVDKQLKVLNTFADGFWGSNNGPLHNENFKNIPIFDYQKLFNLSFDEENKLWERGFPFEGELISNPVSFRLFNYGDYIEISVLYNQENFTERDIVCLCKAYREELVRVLEGEVQTAAVNY